MYGVAGDDTYVVDNAGDVTFEGSALDGTDLVLASVTRSLGANLENLTLTGTAAINGIGNSLGNTINGNSGANQLFGNLGDDVLAGGAGNDLLAGGAGNDAFVFAPGSGSDTVTTFLAGGIDDTLDFSAYNGTGITWTITQVGANTVFDFTNGDQITLTNVIAANLVQTDPFGFG
jgi:Ca2+-binding RTX toxin-like protein